MADISKPYNQNIVTAIDKLAEEPRPDGVKKWKEEVNAYRKLWPYYRSIIL